ncbi:MAG: hypothetical protein F6K35_48980 [Okeania sp. SIO2H7]|nr:hypothetical protein [Okeania sp. SIO2H7]
MSYSDFTIEELETQFNLNIEEDIELFTNIEPVTPSEILRAVLAENLPLALDIDTEKARSELIIAPILVEIRKYFNREIGLFSGTEFNVDRSKGLNGRCDFILSRSPRQLAVTAPVITMVKARDDNLKSGLVQCMAEMVGARIFNEQKNNNINSIYGVVTTGSLWKFMRLRENTISLEPEVHFVGNLESLLGILVWIIKTVNDN